MANILSSWGRLYYSQLQMRKSRLREVKKPAWYHTARKWWAVTATLQGLLTLYSCPPPLCQVWTPTTVFWKIGEGQSWRGQMDPEHRPPPGPQGLPCQLQPQTVLPAGLSFGPSKRCSGFYSQAFRASLGSFDQYLQERVSCWLFLTEAFGIW